MKKTILGFDCSSTTIGWCSLEVDIDTKEITYLDSGYHKVIKKGSITERLVHTRIFINSLLQKVKPDLIGIEQIIEFMKGKSTAKTIIMLTTFNRALALICHDYLNKSPEFFNVMSIRHSLKLTKVFPKKEEMPELTAHHFKIQFPYEKNKKGNLKPENYDRADGMAVALHHAFTLIKPKKNKK
jgi:Holliday junction resolvasome RuvABC endonuclease subunit